MAGDAETANKGGGSVREIKLRAWDKKYKRMFDNHHLVKAYEGLVEAVKIMIPEAHKAPNNGLFLPLGDLNMIFMQYIGLKDKNGRDGCESDIVNTPVGKAVICFGEYSQPMGNREYHMGFYLRFEHEEDIDVYRKDIGYWFPRSNVVGNIYEHGHLLEGCAMPG